MSHCGLYKDQENSFTAPITQVTNNPKLLTNIMSVNEGST